MHPKTSGINNNNNNNNNSIIMGKKPKSTAGKNKALARKYVPDLPQVPQVEEQVSLARQANL